MPKARRPLVINEGEDRQIEAKPDPRKYEEARHAGLPGQNASHDGKANACHNREGRQGAKREYDYFVLRIPVHLKLHWFGAKRPDRPVGFGTWTLRASLHAQIKG